MSGLRDINISTRRDRKAFKHKQDVKMACVARKPVDNYRTLLISHTLTAYDSNCLCDCFEHLFPNATFHKTRVSTLRILLQLGEALKQALKVCLKMAPRFSGRALGWEAGERVVVKANCALKFRGGGVDRVESYPLCGD